jgi:hypothetical protein
VVELRLLRETGQLLRGGGVVDVVAVARLHRHRGGCKRVIRMCRYIIGIDSYIDSALITPQNERKTSTAADSFCTALL